MDWSKPTTQLLGRYQPWHDGHTELFKRAHAKTGQVIIMLRREDGSENNPYSVTHRTKIIVHTLEAEGFKLQKDFDIIEVPNIVNISYGRGVGYTFTEHDLGEDIHQISATKIRKQMREDGDLA